MLRVRFAPLRVAFLGMDVRIGLTVHGQVAEFESGSCRPLLLVGDTGQGKTTTARYLTRWWLANTRRHAHVYAQAPSEWADRCSQPRCPDQLLQPVGHGCRARTCLVVVDGIDLLDDRRLALLPLGKCRAILTSSGGNAPAGLALPEAEPNCVGLVRPDHADGTEAAVLQGQGRLDWPADTIPVIPDQRGPIDFPFHRWQAPAGVWMEAR